ncbi:hypothetical protein ACS8E3_03260 [Psychrobacter sp. 2Y5]|uniref:hypothetical protein n=1 Tax=unclassified Psychrobacter TaxID=196806 RepID=UPI003F4818AD
MSSTLSTQKRNKKLQPKTTASKTVVTSSLAIVIAVFALATSGCNTTQDFKPTASVMVGGHKSI